MPPDDHTADDRRDEPDDQSNEDGSHWLSTLLSALESLERGSTPRSGRRRSDRTIFDYDISIRTGDDLIDESRFEDTPFAREGSTDRPDGRRRDRNRSGDRDGSRSRTRRRPSASDDLLTTRRHDDEFLVTADVAGTDPDDVTVGFDDDTLVVAVSGRELDRIEVPWPDRRAEAAIKNGVLTVRIEPPAGEDGADGGNGDSSTTDSENGDSSTGQDDESESQPGDDDE